MVELEAGLRKEPGNLEARAELERTRSRLVTGYVLDGERARVAGQFDAAEAAFRRALGIMVGYPRAEQGLQQVEIDRRHQGQVQQAEAFLGKGEIARAEQLVRTILAQNPRQPQGTPAGEGDRATPDSHSGCGTALPRAGKARQSAISRYCHWFRVRYSVTNFWYQLRFRQGCEARPQGDHLCEQQFGT